MGLDDRDYMQDRGGPGLGASIASASLGTQLIVVNVVVFLLWMVLPAELMATHFMCSADGVLRHGRVWTLLTASFSHFDFWHLALNMLWLYWFAGDLEAIYGRRNLLALYLTAGIVASLAFILGQQLAGLPQIPALGASGAVMGVIIVATLFFPTATIRFYLLVPIPLWLLASVYVLLDLSGAFRSIQGGFTGVGHLAHLAGAATGAAWKLLDLRPFSSEGELTAGLGLPLFARIRRRLFGAKLRVLPPLPPDERGAPPAARGPQVDRATAARVDELLAKITREGMDALSDDERRFLEEASGKYRG